MKLSIIIPVYNVEAYITECLNSVLPYVDENCEVIIVDDKSTDRTVNMIRNCIMKYSEKNITLICNPNNVGVSASRNFGLRHSTGKYVAFIDGDDYVSKRYINVILQSIKAGLDYYVLSWKKVGGDNKEFYSRSLPNWNKTVWSRVFKKEIIKVMFDERMSWGEDTTFLNDNLNNRMRYGCIDEIVYFYRWGRSGSITSNRLGRK